MKTKNLSLIICLGLALASPLAFGSVESSLNGLKVVLLNSVLPVFAVLGLGFAGFSFLTGSPNAKQHLMYAMTGAIVIFGAQSIVDLLQRVVR